MAAKYFASQFLSLFNLVSSPLFYSWMRISFKQWFPIKWYGSPDWQSQVYPILQYKNSILTTKLTCNCLRELYLNTYVDTICSYIQIAAYIHRFVYIFYIFWYIIVCLYYLLRCMYLRSMQVSLEPYHLIGNHWSEVFFVVESAPCRCSYILLYHHVLQSI